MVFYGRSQTRKSRWARSIFGEDANLVVDCQHAEHPNLRHYVRGQHKAVLLDEIAGPDFVVRNKKAYLHSAGCLTLNMGLGFASVSSASMCSFFAVCHKNNRKVRLDFQLVKKQLHRNHGCDQNRAGQKASRALNGPAGSHPEN